MSDPELQALVRCWATEFNSFMEAHVALCGALARAMLRAVRP